VKTFERIKNELILEYKNLIDESEKTNVENKEKIIHSCYRAINNIDEMTRIYIVRSAQAIVNMVFNGGNSISDIINNNKLGITEKDKDIIDLIKNNYNSDLYNYPAKSNLIQTIYNKIGIDKNLPTILDIQILRKEIESIDSETEEYFIKKRDYDLGMLSLGFNISKNLSPIKNFYLDVPEKFSSEIIAEYNNLIENKKMRV